MRPIRRCAASGTDMAAAPLIRAHTQTENSPNKCIDKASLPGLWRATSRAMLDQLLSWSPGRARKVPKSGLPALRIHRLSSGSLLGRFWEEAI
jgi:hypothetical protein